VQSVESLGFTHFDHSVAKFLTKLSTKTRETFFCLQIKYLGRLSEVKNFLFGAIQFSSQARMTPAYHYQIAVDTPAHSALGSVLTWASVEPLGVGALVRVPFGRRQVLGIVWSEAPAPCDETQAAGIKQIEAVLDIGAPLGEHWRTLLAFAASYYQRSLGEVALAALPGQFRVLASQLDLEDTASTAKLAKRLQAPKKKIIKTAQTTAAGNAGTANASMPTQNDPLGETLRVLTAQQKTVLEQFATEARPCLLWGATGSGKTEVYLQAAAVVLAQDSLSQVMILVPEINLTPQLEERLLERLGQYACVTLHSGLTPVRRMHNWLAAHRGTARVVLGTRMAVLASMPHLRLIVVDEEHDPSYKSQDGARHSARDLAVYRAQREGAQILLGSATPSLESWQACERGRYARLHMPARMGGAVLPALRLVDMRQQPKRSLLSPLLVAAMQQRLAAGQQCLVFINRRGYAPVLHCGACGWKSACPHCSAFRVFHKRDRSLRCHHCGLAEAVPRACPDCGNADISPLGRGTERVEEDLAALLPANTRILRIDADSTRTVGSLQQQLAQMHAGEVDVLVGTQMVTKGHDFRRIGLVAALNVDAALFSSDFRAQERLFALLLQAAGRAGRDAEAVIAGIAPELWIQTEMPQHDLFVALRTHDFARFAAQQLAEREQASVPPFAFQALLRAEAKTQEIARAYLQAAQDAAVGCEAYAQVMVYPPVPHSMARVADVERAQMLIESASRPALQHFLNHWQAALHGIKVKGIIRWAIDVDPAAI
jgi:primosomal protein N' (replication factor Y) (superfamily II helicase)